MPHPTERTCFVTAIGHLIALRPDTTRKQIAKAADLSPPYLTQLLKQSRGDGWELYERLAQACDTTVEQAIALGRRLLASNVGGAPADDDAPTTGTPLVVRNLNGRLNALAETVRQLQHPHQLDSDVVVSGRALALFPSLRSYIDILNQACAADDPDLARSALRHLAEALSAPDDTPTQQQTG